MKATYNKIFKTSLAAMFILLAVIKTGKATTGLIISEFLANPTGTDSPFEFVELKATQYIDFSVTPYSVVFSNNGTATASGWMHGMGITYAFNINSGTVNIGDVVYVGGSSMTPTGTHLKTIDTGVNPGDGFGSFSNSGVLGNGGANADGIAVFAIAASVITSSSVPIDAIFFGTACGTAVVNSGADGYQLPINDLYAGGKLQTTSSLGPDPSSGKNIIATGTYNATTNAFTIPRTWVVDSVVTSGTSLISLTGTTGVAGVENSNLIKIYPNPLTVQAAAIDIFIAEPSKVKSEVYNIVGEKLETIVDKNFPAGENKILFSLKQPAGIYFIKTIIDNKETVIRIVQK